MVTDRFKIFKNELGQVRCVVDGLDNGWFLNTDICDALGIDNPSDALNRLIKKGTIDEEDKFVLTYKECKENDSLDFWEKISGKNSDFSNKTFVNEKAMYALIFSGEKKAAIEFQRWVMSEVLPSINHDGAYVHNQEYLPKKEKGLLFGSIGKAMNEAEVSLEGGFFSKSFETISAQSDIINKSYAEIIASVSTLSGFKRPGIANRMSVPFVNDEIEMER